MAGSASAPDRLEVLSAALEAHLEAARGLEAMFADIEQAASMIADAFASGNKLLLCGNGGSAADAQHIAAEFVGRFLLERRAVPAIALHTNTSNLTAIGNDYGFDQTFSRPVEAFGRSGDVLLGITTSGNSQNVVRARRSS